MSKYRLCDYYLYIYIKKICKLVSKINENKISLKNAKNTPLKNSKFDMF